MSHAIAVRKTYQYRLYRCDKRDQHQQINVAGTVWNHALALQKRYYRLTGKYIPLGVLKAHIANLRMRTARYAFWKQLGSQSVQDVLERLDAGCHRFFKRLAKRPPKYKKDALGVESSTRLKAAQPPPRHNANRSPLNKHAGLLEGNKIQIRGRRYKFVKHRPIGGDIKTLTVKRDAAGCLWLFFSVIEQVIIPNGVTPGKIAGFDFGLNTFLTDHTGKAYVAGLYHRSALRRLRALQSHKDKKPHGSHNRRKAAKLISRTHLRAADKRRDAHFNLAHELCDQFDVLCFQDLNLDGMKRLWGRKVSDLAFGQFLTMLKHVARGWYRSDDLSRPPFTVPPVGWFQAATIMRQSMSVTPGHRRILTERSSVVSLKRHAVLPEVRSPHL